MHSGFLLLLWVAGVGALQRFSLGTLLLVAAAVTAAATLVARRRFFGLMRRIRVLLVAIVALFGWFTPGEAIISLWPELGLSREGLVLALEHALRLVAVVASVAILLERLSVDRLVSGLLAVCRPVAWGGLSAEKLAVRLLLVLRYVELADAAKTQGWRSWLLDDDVVPPVAAVHLRREPVGIADFLVGAALVVTLAAWGVA